MKIRATMSRLLRRLFPPLPAETLTAAMREGSEAGRKLQEGREREAFLTRELAKLAQAETTREADRAFHSMMDELLEAQSLAGAGPWKVGPAALQATESLTRKLREGIPLREDFINTQGSYGDFELALSTVDWRREINYSVLQFSRWGIKQIQLIARLYWLKNPIIRRLIDVCAAYVFARGVEVTTGDDTANDTLKEFFEDNKKVFGQVALVQTERSKDTDGNVFWCFFADKVNSGKTKARIIDATEIDEIISDPEDVDTPWYYLRIWIQANVREDGTVSNETQHAWYPAMGFEPSARPAQMRNWPVLWDACVLHRKCGQVGKWMFGCPRIYPALDWAKEARRYLEACASVAQQLAQFALMLKTKGGQQAMAGAKQQISTTIGPSTPLWDTNPPAVAGAVFASGTGTDLTAFKTAGAGQDPDKVRWYAQMCCMVKGVPSTFIADLDHSNLATATSLDRPTETVFLEAQEAWREDLTTIAKFVLRVSAGAASGKLSEAGWGKRITILECRRSIGPRGECVYEAFSKKPDTIEVQVNFPAIREGDMPMRIKAIVEAMTLDNKGGQVIGIDEKEGVKLLFRELGVEEGDEITETMYPSTGKDKYDPNRAEEVLPQPIQKAQLVGGKPQIGPDGKPLAEPPAQAPPLVDKKTKEAMLRVSSAITELVENGHSRR